MKALTSKQLIQKITVFADDKKAQDIVVLDMRELVNFCDYFVIATGTSDRHVKAIAEGIADDLSLLGVKVNLGKALKGYTPHTGTESEGAWMLLDMGDVVVHVFEPQSREFYGLEHLWQDAPRIAQKVKAVKRKKSA